ncbi:MAG TPA: hypothetical protein VHX88_03510 [Solirubrobacteraceae bacterium]|jgi:hypothetical protein|nr:hypothetical protein [Solirubrobacteraceae bacterium]
MRAFDPATPTSALGFQQSIGASEALRTGTCRKTIQLTLSTDSP